MPDIKEGNILLGLADPSIVEQLDTEEIAELSFYKVSTGTFSIEAQILVF